MVLWLLGTTLAMAQDPLAGLPNLVPNGGFEQGQEGWRISIGPRDWSAATGVAEVLEREADAGERCLRLNAREQDAEVDASLGPVAIGAGTEVLLNVRVRQLAGEGGYKATLDWQDAQGKHLAYANDWRGNDHPAGFANHGGIFLAPEGAAQVVLLLGVSKGAECLFDEVRLSPLPGPPAQDAPDGGGRLEASLPASIEAGAYGTFRFTWQAGERGLPPGGALYLRRDNLDVGWSRPQGADPQGPGYTTAVASNGALLAVEAGAPGAVPQVTRIAVVYPGLKPGDSIAATYGDTSAGSPGAQAQTKAEAGIRFVLAVDGDRDGMPLDLPPTAPVDVLPGPFAALGLIAPAVAEVGVAFPVMLEARDRHGNRVPTYAGTAALSTDATSGLEFTPDRSGRRQARVTFRKPGVQALRAQAGGAQAEQTVVVTASPARPAPARAAGAHGGETDGTLVLENPHVRLLLPRNDFGYGVAFLEARGGEAWKPVGTLPSLGELRIGEAGAPAAQTPVWLPDAEVKDGEEAASVVLTGVLQAGVPWDVSVECSLSASARHVAVRCRATPRSAVPLRAFRGPVLCAGDGAFGAAKQSALLPGVEYLTADEVSSGEYGIVPPHSDRRAPDPYKLTLPLMAVASEDLCAGLFWEPTAAWAQGRHGPGAYFASPERWEGREAHALGLLAPSVRDGLPENARELEQPLTIGAGETLTLSSALVALPAGDVTAAVRYWFEMNGVPDPPPLPRPWGQAAELTARGFVETAWEADKRGWHSALADPWGAAYNGEIALRLRHFAQRNPASPLTPRIEAQLAEASAQVGSLPGFDLAFHLGNAAEAWRAERAAGVRDALAMAADGSYAFHPHTGTKMASQAQSKSMGPDGEVNVGTCTMGLEPLMRRALLTGDPFLIAQGEKGLACLDRFTRPQGAENWEVPLACPNLRASALATRCYLYGYLLTGKDGYLQKARYWATTGLPFIYLWSAPDRPIMRYASISVMGTTYHTHTWFGRPVQWVGLVYADALRELAAHDGSFPWRKVAEGILIAAQQMQKTQADACGHVGFYPDAYSTLDGKEAYHWCLAPTGVAALQDALRGPDPKVSTTVLRAGDRTVHLAAPGEVTDAALDGDDLSLTCTYLAGSTHEVVVAHVAAVEAVLVDGKPLSPSLAEPEAPGYELSPPLLRLRVRHEQPAARIEVRGCRLAEPAALVNPGAIPNGDFETGLTGWAPDPADRVRAVADSHGGASALELDAIGLASEVQCPSGPMTVEAGRTYELTSWVKQTAGDGRYKVTIDWLGAGGHLAYDNDWLGTNRPAAFSPHGGRFTAPPGAQAAVIILGVQPGARCVFDSIALK